MERAEIERKLAKAEFEVWKAAGYVRRQSENLARRERGAHRDTAQIGKERCSPHSSWLCNRTLKIAIGSCESWTP